MTANIKSHTLWPAHRIHLPAFFAALFLAPILWGLLGAPLIVPFFAMLFGGVPYLIFGTPLLLWYLGRRPCRALPIAGLAFLANLSCALCLGGLSQAGYFRQFGDWDQIVLAFGSFFAPLWGATFAWLYNSMTPARAPQSFTRNHPERT